MRTATHHSLKSPDTSANEDPIIVRLKAGLIRHDEAIAHLEKLAARNRGETRKMFEGMLTVSRGYRKVAQDLLDGLLDVAEHPQAA